MTLRDLAAAADAARPRHARLVAEALGVIAELDPQTTIVSWSGGKDSTVLLDLACRAWPDGVVALLNLPHLVARRPLLELVDAWQARRPHLDVLVRCSPPDARADRVQVARVARRLGASAVLLGLRADESGRRRTIAGTIARSGSYITGADWGRLRAHCPLLRWSERDVWTYIRAHGLPVHEHYERAGEHARSPHTPIESDLTRHARAR